MAVARSGVRDVRDGPVLLAAGSRYPRGVAATHSFGRYRVTGTLGAVAMGELYAAIDDVLGREVAVKTLCGLRSQLAARNDPSGFVATTRPGPRAEVTAHSTRKARHARVPGVKLWTPPPTSFPRGPACKSDEILAIRNGSVYGPREWFLAALSRSRSRDHISHT